MSPEIMESKPYDYKSDIWSLGCVAYEMMTLKHAFDATDMSSLVLKIMRGEHLPIPTAGFSPELRELVKSMLCKAPKGRPSTEQLLRAPLMREAVARARERAGEPAPPPGAGLATATATGRIAEPATGPRSWQHVRTSGAGALSRLDRDLSEAKARLRHIAAERSAVRGKASGLRAAEAPDEPAPAPAPRAAHRGAQAVSVSYSEAPWRNGGAAAAAAAAAGSGPHSYGTSPDVHGHAGGYMASALGGGGGLDSPRGQRRAAAAADSHAGSPNSKPKRPSAPAAAAPPAPQGAWVEREERLQRMQQQVAAKLAATALAAEPPPGGAPRDDLLSDVLLGGERPRGGMPEYLSSTDVDAALEAHREARQRRGFGRLDGSGGSGSGGFDSGGNPPPLSLSGGGGGGGDYDARCGR
jgi:hypothetical protein